MGTVNVSKACPCCGKVKSMEVDGTAYLAWKQGALIQNVFPDLSSDEREFLISGICPDCWEKYGAESSIPLGPTKLYTGPEDPDIPF